MAEAAEALGRDLGANRAGFFQTANEDTLEFGASWTDGVLEPLAGPWPVANIGAHYLGEIRAGRAFGIADTARDPTTAGSPFGARGLIVAPIIRDGRCCAGLYVNHAIARDWTAGEIEFVRDVADITWDVVERSRTMTAMRESEKLFREIADVAPVLIWMSDTTKACVWFNKPWLDFTGRTMEQELGDGWAEGVHPDDFDRCVATYNGAFDRREPFRMDYRLKRHDGLWRVVNDIGVQRFSSDGTFLGYIGSCLDVTGQREAEAALRDSEERFRGIFENAATGIVLLDADGHFRSCNPAFSAMLGYSEQELRRFCFAKLMHPEDRDANVYQFRRLAAQEMPSYEIVNRYLHKDGKSIWVHKHVSLLRDATGRPTNTITLVTDITGRKRQEDQIRLLMSEVNHRSKNMLALVQAVARQTLAANPQDFLDRFGKRIEALAASQDLLVKNAWKGVHLNELVRSQLAPFEDLIGTRIDLQGPPLFVSASAAQVVGMALHELATNAGKYGALSGADGSVAITWCIQHGDREEKMFIMNWCEQCAHSITGPAKLGFGSSVIGSMAEMSLGAKVELSFPATGLTWQLRCVADEVLDAGVRALPGGEGERPRSSSALTKDRPRILVVEDEALVAIEIAHVLTEAGFEIVGPARRVSAALELLRRSGCDAAVLDINLGRETSEAIAAELTASETPFVTLSGYSEEEHHSAFAAAPALTKPVRPEPLIAELRKCIEKITRADPALDAELSARERGECCGLNDR